MKYGNSFFIQLPRELFTDKYKELSLGAKWLFVWLNELEHRYTKHEIDCFYRTDEDLANDLNVSVPSLRKYKKELRNTDLISVSYMHWVDSNGKKSEKKVTAYRINK